MKARSTHRFDVAAAGVMLALLSCVVRAEVIVNGIEGPLLTNVEALIRVRSEDCAAPRRRIESGFESAHGEIRLALEAYGYYEPAIESSLSFAEECWSAVYTIEVGERVLLRSVDMVIEGNASTDAAFTALLAEARLAPMQPLLHGEYDALKQALRTLAIERGYRDARFVESTLEIFPEELSADLRIVFDSGERYRFGELILEQDILNDELLSRYVSSMAGEYYDSRLLTDARLELINSGYFDSVSIEPGIPVAGTREIPVRLRLTPAARAQINYGFGFSTDTGPRFRFGRSIRRLNDKGHQLYINGMFSPVVTEASADYRLPYGDPRSEWISFDLGGIREETDTSTSRSLQAGARRVVTGESAWTRADLLNFLVEDFEIGSQTGRTRLLMPGVEWVRLISDDAIRPDRGSRMTIQLRGGSDSLGSDTSVVQLLTSAKWIWPLPRASRLLVRGELGGIWYDDFSELPPSLRFFAGGDNSVRGYGFETLGPVNDLDEVIGGSRLLTASVEFEKRVKQAWSVAVFTDTGNAFSGSDADLHSSFGIGARWQSPLGPVRFDIAEPLDGDDRDARIHITLGPDL